MHILWNRLWFQKLFSPMPNCLCSLPNYWEVFCGLKVWRRAWKMGIKLKTVYVQPLVLPILFFRNLQLRAIVILIGMLMPIIWTVRPQNQLMPAKKNANLIRTVSSTSLMRRANNAAHFQQLQRPVQQSLEVLIWFSKHAQKIKQRVCLYILPCQVIFRVFY